MRTLIRKALDRLPYVGNLREQVRAAGSFPPGHFYSPVPARGEIDARFRTLSEHAATPDVNLNTEAQRHLLRAFEAFYDELPFREERNAECRYYFNQHVFCYADAIFLYSFLRHVQPRRIIEVGSGFSSAVMLDTVDRFFPERPRITLIEPFPANLRTLLRPEDYSDITLIEETVQRVPLAQFSCLQAGDLLFIDSSHVVKCGSDLQFLIFEVLPQLPAGVFVHFHDVFDAFEYPREWLRKGRYWNEDYVLRAFLSYNSAWDVYWFGNYAVRAFRGAIAERMPLCLRNPGGSLYIRRAA